MFYIVSIPLRGNLEIYDTMEPVTISDDFNWGCIHTWKIASYNTLWCLFGCSIGDMGTIAYFQFTNSDWSTTSIMALPIINGLLTSIFLETLILYKKMRFVSAFKTACGMSLISMISMEVVMNIVDVMLVGGAILTLWVIPLMLISGFITPLPYNYWRLKVYGKSCH